MLQSKIVHFISELLLVRDSLISGVSVLLAVIGWMVLYQVGVIGFLHLLIGDIYIAQDDAFLMCSHLAAGSRLW